MLKKPDISVIIPAWNEEKLLPDCLESLKNQTLPKEKFEVVVVDNNSTDKTREIAESYGSRIIGCQVQGVAAARVAGSEGAYGEIIAGTDADTQVAPEWLETIASHFEKDPDLLGLTGPTYFKEANFFSKNLSFFAFDVFQRLNFAIRKPTFSGFNYAVRVDAYREIGGINPELESAEDIDLSFRLAKKGKVEYVSDVVVYTSARRIKKEPFGFFRHNIKNYFLMLTGKEPEPFKPIR